MYEQWMLPNTCTFPLYSPSSNISIQLQDLLTLGKKRPEVSKKAPGGNQEQWMPWTQGSTPFSGQTSPNPADLGKANVWAPFLQMTLIFSSWLPQENNIAVNRLLKTFFFLVSVFKWNKKDKNTKHYRKNIKITCFACQLLISKLSMKFLVLTLKQSFMQRRDNIFYICLIIIMKTLVMHLEELQSNQGCNQRIALLYPGEFVCLN